LEVGLSACVVGPKRRVPGDALDYHPATSVRPVCDRDEIFRVELLQAQPIRERKAGTVSKDDMAGVLFLRSCRP
jgi:hypothetical protein